MPPAESNIKGLSELQKFLDKVPVNIETKIVRGALRQAATDVLLADVRRRAAKHVLSGDLLKGIKVGTSARRGQVRAYVRSTDFKSNWLEFGTAAHAISAAPSKFLNFGGVFMKSVMHPGATPHAFMRPALDARKVEAVIAVGNAVRARLSTKAGFEAAETAYIKIEGDE